MQYSEWLERRDPKMAEGFRDRARNYALAAGMGIAGAAALPHIGYTHLDQNGVNKKVQRRADILAILNSPEPQQAKVRRLEAMLKDPDHENDGNGLKWALPSIDDPAP
jgi:hypothetical protein